MQGGGGEPPIFSKIIKTYTKVITITWVIFSSGLHDPTRDHNPTIVQEVTIYHIRLS